METLSAKEREVQQSQDMKEQLFTESQSMMDDLKDQNQMYDHELKQARAEAEKKDMDFAQLGEALTEKENELDSLQEQFASQLKQLNDMQ